MNIFISHPLSSIKQGTHGKHHLSCLRLKLFQEKSFKTPLLPKLTSLLATHFLFLYRSSVWRPFFVVGFVFYPSTAFLAVKKTSFRCPEVAVSFWLTVNTCPQHSSPGTDQAPNCSFVRLKDRKIQSNWRGLAV